VEPIENRASKRRTPRKREDKKTSYPKDKAGEIEGGSSKGLG
jgi:hypothetical protein